MRGGGRRCEDVASRRVRWPDARRACGRSRACSQTWRLALSTRKEMVKRRMVGELAGRRGPGAMGLDVGFGGLGVPLTC